MTLCLEDHRMFWSQLLSPAKRASVPSTKKMEGYSVSLIRLFFPAAGNMEVDLGDKGIPEVIWSLEVDSSLQNIPTCVLSHLTLNIQVMWEP